MSGLDSFCETLYFEIRNESASTPQYFVICFILLPGEYQKQIVNKPIYKGIKTAKVTFNIVYVCPKKRFQEVHNNLFLLSFKIPLFDALLIYQKPYPG